LAPLRVSFHGQLASARASMSSEEENAGRRPNKRRSVIGSFLRSVFHKNEGRKKAAGANPADKNKRKQLAGTSPTPSPEEDFGVEKTERLTHFARPKPPQNRRRPKSSHPVAVFKDKRQQDDVHVFDGPAPDRTSPQRAPLPLAEMLRKRSEQALAKEVAMRKEAQDGEQEEALKKRMSTSAPDLRRKKSAEISVAKDKENNSAIRPLWLMTKASKDKGWGEDVELRARRPISAGKASSGHYQQMISDNSSRHRSCPTYAS